MSISLMCPRRESNPHRRFRKPMFYPLNYEDILGKDTLFFPKAQLLYPNNTGK